MINYLFKKLGLINHINKIDEINEALDVISKHGYEANYYLPSMSFRSDEELSNALDVLSMSGHIITDKDGCIVGKAAKVRLSSKEKVQAKRSIMKVVK